MVRCHKITISWGIHPVVQYILNIPLLTLVLHENSFAKAISNSTFVSFLILTQVAGTTSASKHGDWSRCIHMALGITAENQHRNQQPNIWSVGSLLNHRQTYFLSHEGPTTKQWFHVFSSAMTTVSLKLSMPGISGGIKFYQPRVDGYVGVPENWVYIGIIQKVSQGKYHDEAANLQLPRSPTNSYV